jgi:hypothetical protein
MQTVKSSLQSYCLLNIYTYYSLVNATPRRLLVKRHVIYVSYVLPHTLTTTAYRTKGEQCKKYTHHLEQKRTATDGTQLTHSWS